MLWHISYGAFKIYFIYVTMPYRIYVMYVYNICCGLVLSMLSYVLYGYVLCWDGMACEMLWNVTCCVTCCVLGYGSMVW